MNCSNGTPMRSAVCCVIAGRDEPRRDAVDVDVERAELDRERLRHPLQPGLRGRVVRLAAVAERRRRRDQHHLPALLLDHVLLRRAHGVERALQVRVDDGVPVVVAHLEEHVVADDPGARDEDVERAAVRRPPPRPPPRRPRASSRRSGRRGRRSPVAVSCAAASSKSATTTVAPSAASRCAVAAPMPFAPPVTSAVFPANLVMRGDDIRCPHGVPRHPRARGACTARSCPTRSRASRSSASPT